MIRQDCKVGLCRHMVMGEQPCRFGCLEALKDLKPVREISVTYEELVANKADKGLRFNKGKLRYDLLHPVAQDGIVRVLTKGAEKYEERNWEKGMKWTTVLASMKRHIAAIERGEDYDPETGELHIDHVQCNAHFLSAYYKIYPQGDDRRVSMLGDVKIALDIDEVLCDWLGSWCERFKYDVPEFWNFSYDNKAHFESLHSSGELEEFYLSLQPKIKPSELPFEPYCYITSRSVPTEITQKWLQMNGFPSAPVHSVGFGISKVEVAKREGIDIMIDDSYANYKELNNAGICCFLWDAPHNRRYDVGFKRINNLNDIM